MLLRFFGYLALGAALVLACSVLYLNSLKSQIPLIFTPSQVLEATWLNYKTGFVEQDTFRTIDKDRNNITTSEGQSYTMLRAVWMSDKATFDGAWKWTQQNIQHQKDSLFAWEWGQLPNGSYGVLTADNGQNSASDADQDIAMALVFAYARWQDPSYLSAARAVIDDIWNHEIVTIAGTPYLAADDIEKTAKSAAIVVNPSYFNPAAYRIFALVDASHPWSEVAQSSYQVLSSSMSLAAGTTTSDGLPPDWIGIDRSTGSVIALTDTTGADTNFGFDAMRVPFMLALDYAWFATPEDAALLARMSFLRDKWRSYGSIASIYGHDGSEVVSDEASSIYGGTIGYFLVADQADAKSVYEKKLLFLYNPGANEWKTPLSYYDDNWAWFGIGIYNGLLPNLASGLPESAYVR